MSERRSILLLCNDDRRHAANVRQHIRALSRQSRHDVRTFNPLLARPAELELERYDAVVIHYTVVPIIETYLPRWLSDEIERFRGVKAQFIQDEYRWIDAVTAKVRELGIDLLFTCVPEGEVSKVYGDRVPETRTVTTLAGFIPEELVQRLVPPLAERPLDVGYRGRTIPYWLGRLGQEKLEIGREFAARARDHGLECDIAWSENERIYGEDWVRFLASCRATLGTESGASIADYDGSVERQVTDYIAERPAASFEEVERDVLAPYEGNIDLRVISPRQFEAAALRTALVLFPGRYSGILEAGRHYIPLQKDFSNLDEVAEQLRDLPFLEQLVARTHDEVALEPRYSLGAFVREFDDLIAEGTGERASAGGRRRPASPRRQLRGPLQRAVGNSAHKALKTAFSLAVVTRRTPLRKLAEAYVRDRSAREQIPPSALLDDLLKLGVLLDAQTASANGAAPFQIEPSFDPRRRQLTLGSRKTAARPALPKREVEQALRRGELEIVWNHLAIGREFRVPLRSKLALRVHVGYHGVDGAHSFRALRRLGPRMPEQVLAALEPLLGRPTSRP